MAFRSAANHTSLPNGVFSATIYSKKVQMALRKRTVVQGITNNDYFGEIANHGDSVKIIKEPEVQITDYARGAKVTPQDLLDSDFTLIIDQSNAFSFKVDDIEAQHSHVNFMGLATDRAAYRLADYQDRNVLGYLSGYQETNGVWAPRTTFTGTKAEATADNDEMLAAHKLTRGTFNQTNPGNSIVLGVDGTYDSSPLQLLNRIKRIMDLKNVPEDSRWVVVDPVFMELLADENSKFVHSDWMGSAAVDTMKNGRVGAGMIRGFKIFQSNNLVSVGLGPSKVTVGGSTVDYGLIVAGTNDAVAFAQQINKTEKLRDQDSFADVVRGMNLYGRKIIRPDSIVTARYNVNK